MGTVNLDEARAISEGSRSLDQMQTIARAADRPQTVQAIELDLSTARSEFDPKPILFSFKSIFVESATDPNSFFYLRPGTKEEVQSYFKMTNRDSLVVSSPIPNAYLHWPAQPGKKMRVIVFTDAEFRSGSQQSVNSGGVSVNEGASCSGPVQATLTALTAGKIFDTDFSRKVSIAQNNTGAIVYIAGDNTVTNAGSTKGLEINPGAFIEWRNTGPLYGYSVAGGSLATITET